MMPYTNQGVGYQSTDTSKNAAVDLSPKASTIRDFVIKYLKRVNCPATSEEIAAGIGLDYVSVQPRLSELQASGHVRDSGQRKKSRYNKNIIAWEMAKGAQGELFEHLASQRKTL